MGFTISRRSKTPHVTAERASYVLSMVLTVIFWILLILLFIAALVPDSVSPYLGRGRWIILLLLVTILGFHCLGNPMSR